MAPSLGPSLGRIVHYKLTDGDAQAVNRRRATMGRGDMATGEQLHVGARVAPGDLFAAMVVRVAGATVNLQVFLDGNDVLWLEAIMASHVEAAEAPLGTWSWPTRMSH
jgi:hypothetical protein